MFDLVIRNGTVIDGSGAPRRVADVAVQDGRIAAVGPGLRGGKREIDVAAFLQPVVAQGLGCEHQLACEAQQVQRPGPVILPEGAQGLMVLAE